MVRTTVLTGEGERSAAAENGGAEAQIREGCPACGAALEADQEWCLECGAAVTQIHAPPDWKIGLAIVLGVIAVVAIVAAIVWP